MDFGKLWSDVKNSVSNEANNAFNAIGGELINRAVAPLKSVTQNPSGNLTAAEIAMGLKGQAPGPVPPSASPESIARPGGASDGVQISFFQTTGGMIAIGIAAFFLFSKKGRK